MNLGSFQFYIEKQNKSKLKEKDGLYFNLTHFHDDIIGSILNAIIIVSFFYYRSCRLLMWLLIFYNYYKSPNMKNILLLALLCVSVLSITDKEIIQQTLNGLFEQNKLPDPKTIVPCIDDATAHNIVVFGGEILDKAARGSIADLLSLKDLIEKFGDSIPESVKTCLEGNAEFEALGLKYGITPDTDSSVIEKKIIQYVTLHYLTVHKWLGGLNDNWKAAKYYQVGYDAATYGHTILQLSEISIPQISDKDIIQQALNGLFEENQMKDPTTIVPCIDDATAHKIVVFIGEVISKAAKGSISDLLSLKDLIKNFGDQIPESVKTCLDGNAEFEALGLKYGIKPDTDSSAIEKKVIQYVTLHYLTVHKWLGDLNTEWSSGKYYQFGFDAAKYGHTVLGLGESGEEVSRFELKRQGNIFGKSF